MAGLIQGADGLMRAEPAVPVEAMKTYQIVAPQRAAACAEVECEFWQQGWASDIDETTDLGAGQALYIRQGSGRRFAESRTDAGLTRFTFYPGQDCFGSHKLPAADERYRRRGGDWRGNPLGDRYEFTRPDDWVDDFATSLDQFQAAKERG
jgi:hypothetical protein